MQDTAPVPEMLEIVASTGPLAERAGALVDVLDRWLPVDAIWLALSDPGSTVTATVGSAGLDRPVLDYLARPSVAHEIQVAGLHRHRPPVVLSELPARLEERPTWAECLVPAGFRDGLGVPLCDDQMGYVGMLTLLFTHSPAPPVAVRQRLGELAPLIARGISPSRSLLATARLVRGATSGSVLLRDGTGHALPGLAPADDVEPPVVDLVRRALVGGQVFHSFLWPEADGTGHLRVTALAATDAPPFVLGMLLVTPGADCRRLSPRELEVLGLIVDGRSNQEIAGRLGIVPRTVATHVEHILHKLEVPTRTLAAVRAQREGCHVPPYRR